MVRCLFSFVLLLRNMETKLNAHTIWIFILGGWGGGEGGWYGWFGFCKNFFPQTSGDTIIIIVRFFPALYAMKSIFFQCRNFFRQAFPYKKCISLEQSVGNFSLKWPIPPSPLKSQMVSPLQEINCLNMASKTVSFSVFKKSLIIHKEKNQKKLMLNVCP